MRIPIVVARYIREAVIAAMTPIMDGAPVLTSQLSRTEQSSLQCIALEQLQKQLKAMKKDHFQYGWFQEAIGVVSKMHRCGNDIYGILIGARIKWRKNEGLATNNTSYHTGRCCPWGRTEPLKKAA